MFDTLFLVCPLFVAPCTIIRASWETKKERFSYPKKYIEKIVWGTSLFWLHSLLSMSLFVAFFVFSLPLPKWRTCLMVPIKIHIIFLWVVFCVMTSRVNGRKYKNLWQVNTSCSVSLRTWYYFNFFLTPVVLAMTFHWRKRATHMFCSTNKLKSHVLFTCKKFMSSDFTWKKFFCFC